MIDDSLIRSACGDGDENDIATLASALLSNLERRERRIKDGGTTHLRPGDIPDSLAGNLAYRMTKAFLSQNSAPPRELMDLLRRCLGQNHPSRKGKGQTMALLSARAYLTQYPAATDSEISRMVKVSRSTVGRWRKGGDLTR